MKDEFYRFMAVMNFVFVLATFGGYEADMFGLGRCLLQMLFFFAVGCVFSILAENEYYKGGDK